MLLMNVAGAVVRGVSIMYATTVGREEATASVMMAPEADHVKISICPGVSINMWLIVSWIPSFKETLLTRHCSLASPRSPVLGQTWS